MIVSTHISVEEGEATWMGIPAKSTRSYREAHDCLTAIKLQLRSTLRLTEGENEHARTPLAQMQFNALTVSTFKFQGAFAHQKNTSLLVMFTTSKIIVFATILLNITSRLDRLELLVLYGTV